MTRYYYSKDGTEVQGPITPDDLQQMHSVGILDNAAQVCPEGSDSWEPITNVFPVVPSFGQDFQSTKVALAGSRESRSTNEKLLKTNKWVGWLFIFITCLYALVVSGAASLGEYGFALLVTVAWVALIVALRVSLRSRWAGITLMTLVIGLFIMGTFIYFQADRVGADSKATLNQPSATTAQAIATPILTPAPSKTPSQEMVSALSQAIVEARQKCNLMLDISKMNMDISVSDDSYVRNDTAVVNVEIDLLSADGQSIYMDGSLKRDVYPSIKACYLEALERHGFLHNDVGVITNVTGH